MRGLDQLEAGRIGSKPTEATHRAVPPQVRTDDIVAAGIKDHLIDFISAAKVLQQCELAVELGAFDAEIVYRHLRIGTTKRVLQLLWNGVSIEHPPSPDRRTTSDCYAPFTRRFGH